MEILYLIGNGFDLAQGFKTRYTDFYPFYVERSIINPAIKKICAEIGRDYYTWADLEYRLGQYSIEIDKNDFDDVYYDLSDKLQEYLKRETRGVTFTENDLNKLKADFIQPYEYLSGIEQESLRNMYANASNFNINVISFNYTDVLDKALPKLGFIGTTMGVNAYYKNLYHIHGVLDKTIILGVNDKSQIANEDFAEDEDIKDLLVKPQSNDAIRSLEAVYCQQLISRADVIILYGLSIGETDKLWWNLIGEKLKINKDTKVVIFKYEENPIDPTKTQKLGAKRRLVIDDFMKKMGLLKDSVVRSRIYVSFDTTFMKTV